MKKIIYQFVKDTKLAIVGVSRNREKWGRALFRMLSDKGYDVYPVNPNCEEIDGVRCYKDITELPENVENIILTVPPKVGERVVRVIPDSNIRRVWFHSGAGQGAFSQSALEYCTLKGIEAVHGLCPLMFFPKPGIHKIHYLFVKLFGMLPKGYRD